MLTLNLLASSFFKEELVVVVYTCRDSVGLASLAAHTHKLHLIWLDLWRKKTELRCHCSSIFFQFIWLYSHLVRFLSLIGLQIQQISNIGSDSVQILVRIYILALENWPHKLLTLHGQRLGLTFLGLGRLIIIDWINNAHLNGSLKALLKFLYRMADILLRLFIWKIVSVHHLFILNDALFLTRFHYNLCILKRVLDVECIRCGTLCSIFMCFCIDPGILVPVLLYFVVSMLLDQLRQVAVLHFNDFKF